MEVQANRVQERAGMNAARSLFEANKYVFQEVDLGNDYGKDVYVDLTEKGKLTGLCIALQVKGGISYRRQGGYGIPLDRDHADYWMKSSMPVAGIVFDPENGKLHWTSISEYLHDLRGEMPSYVPVDAENVLDESTLESKFKPAFAAFQAKRIVGPALLLLTDPEEKTQAKALRECFILGRMDGRVLIMIRHLLHLFKGEVLRRAVVFLSHATSHPDIFWTPDNWIPQAACDALAQRLDWSIDEISILMESSQWEEWHRGGYGQCVYSLLCADRKIEKKMSDVAIRALNEGRDELAFRTMYLAIYWAKGEGTQLFDGFCRFDRRFGRLEHSDELKDILENQGCVFLFE